MKLDALEIPETDEDLYGQEKLVEEPTEQFVTLRLSSDWYGLNLTDIREIDRVGQIAYLPSVPDHILGVMSLRGNIVPVTGLARLLNLTPSSVSDKSRIVVIGRDAAEMGLLVDEVDGVVSVPQSKLEPPLSTLPFDHGNFIRHTCSWGARLIGILHVDSLLEGGTIQRDQKSSYLGETNERREKFNKHSGVWACGADAGEPYKPK